MSSQRIARVGLRGGKGKSYSLAEKLASRTLKRPNGCWEAQGYPVHGGYVQIGHGCRTNGTYFRRGAHVLAWELSRGPVPTGYEVCHRCDNPRCVNPDHLFLASHRDNILDSIRKGRYNAFGIQKLNAEQVREIRALAARGMRQRDIAAQFGIARNSVSGIVNRKSWDHLDRPTVGVGNVNAVPMPPFVSVPVRGDLHAGQSDLSRPSAPLNSVAIGFARPGAGR